MSESGASPFFSSLLSQLKKTVSGEETSVGSIPTAQTVSLWVESASIGDAAIALESAPTVLPVNAKASGPLNLSGPLVSGLQTQIVKIPQPDKNVEKKNQKRESGRLSPAQLPHVQAASWGEHGITYLAAGSFNQALECAEQALRLDAKNGLAWHCRGAALFALQRFTEAAQALHKAVTLRPQNVEAWVLFGQALFKIELFQQCLECCTSALRYAPHHTEALLCQARSLDRLRHFRAACEAYERFLQQKPNEAIAWCEYGEVLCQLNQQDAALECYERVAQIHPTKSENWLRLANFLTQLGRPAEAMAGYNTALELEPYQPAIWFNRGLALAAMGRYEDAEKSYQRVLELQPNDMATHYQMALTFMQRFIEMLEQGRVFNAKEYWQRAVQLGRRTPLRDWYEVEFQYLQKAAALGHQRLAKVLIARLTGNTLLGPLDCALDFLLTQNRERVISLPTHIRQQVIAIIRWCNPLSCPVE